MIQLPPGVTHSSKYLSEALRVTSFVFRYATGVTKLTEAQTKFLGRVVVPRLNAAGVWAEFYATADRSGSHAVNYRVSKDRLTGLQTDLLLRKANPRVVFAPQHKYLGEDFAESVGEDNGGSEEYYRAVAAYIWPSHWASRQLWHDTVLVRFARAHARPPG